MEENWKICSFDSWYEKFSNKTVASECITLSEEFINYLNEDGVVLPDCIDDSKFIKKEEKIKFEKEQNLIKDTIKRYGDVFPKLNWSSPRVNKNKNN